MQPIYTTDIRLTYAEYSVDIRPKNDSEIIIIRLYPHSWFFMVTKISVSGRISAVYRPYVSHISAVYRPSVSRISAVHRPYVSRISAVHRPYVSRLSAGKRRYVSHHMSAVYQPYIHRMSAACLISQYARVLFRKLVKMGGDCSPYFNYWTWGMKWFEIYQCTVTSAYIWLKYLIKII